MQHIGVILSTILVDYFFNIIYNKPKKAYVGIERYMLVGRNIC